MTCEAEVLEYMIAKGLIEDFRDNTKPIGEPATAAEIIIEQFEKLINASPMFKLSDRVEKAIIEASGILERD